jgi:hypothetical protein
MRVIVIVFLCCFATACNSQWPESTPISSPVTATTAVAQLLFVQDVVPHLMSSTELTLYYYWKGLSPRAPYEVKTNLNLTNIPATSVLVISVGDFSANRQVREVVTELSQEQLSSAIALLSQIELFEEEYNPTFTHTDDYPTLSMTFVSNGNTIVFRTTSQGEKHMPWQVLIGGKSYTIISEDIFTVWEIFQPTLKPKELEAIINSN